jgi:hypothetical protein
MQSTAEAFLHGPSRIFERDIHELHFDSRSLLIFRIEESVLGRGENIDGSGVKAESEGQNQNRGIFIEVFHTIKIVRFPKGIEWILACKGGKSR